MPGTTMSIRRAAGLAVVAIVGLGVLAPSTPAGAAGVTTHGWMATEAIDRVTDPDLEALLDAHRDQVRAGGMFPDAGYVAPNTFGEEAHWQRFVVAYADQILARDDCGDLRDPSGPCADMVAHLMGVAAHGMGDEVWDWLFEPYSPDLAEYWTDPAVPLANEGGAEFQMDIVAVGDHGIPRPTIPDLPSIGALLAAFEEAGLGSVTADQFNLNGLGELVWDLERNWADTYLDDIRAAMPWMSANMVTAPGGVNWAATAIAGYWDVLWGRLLGEQPATSVSITYPAPDQTDVPASGWERTFQPGSARGRGGARNRITAALTFAKPYRAVGGPPVSGELPAGTMTITDRATGSPLPLMSGYPRTVPYGGDAGQHLIDVQPASDLAPCTWYDVEVGVDVPLLDADGEPVIPHTWSFRTDDGAGGTECLAETGTLPGTIASDAGPVSGAAVHAYAPDDGLAPTASATTTDDGSYELTGLAPGAYRLYIAPPAGSGLHPEWSGDATNRGAATEIAVPGAARGDAVLDAAATLGGTVRGTGGDLLPGVAVWAYAPHDVWLPTAMAVTDADGRYDLPSLAPGTYTVAFRPPAGSGLTVQWSGGSSSRGAGTPVDLSPSAPATLDHTFTASASVSGTVTAVGGPAVGARVVFFGPSDTWLGSFETTTDSSGNYRIDAAPPGTYRVWFVPPAGQGLLPTWFDDTDLRREATPVVLSAGVATDDVSGHLILIQDPPS